MNKKRARAAAGRKRARAAAGVDWQLPQESCGMGRPQLHYCKPVDYAVAIWQEEQLASAHAHLLPQLHLIDPKAASWRAALQRRKGGQHIVWAAQRQAHGALSVHGLQPDAQQGGIGQVAPSEHCPSARRKVKAPGARANGIGALFS